MSKTELERRLDQNKYELYKALRAVWNSDPEVSLAVQIQVEDVLNKIEEA